MANGATEKGQSSRAKCQKTMGEQGPSTRPRWPTASGTWPLRNMQKSKKTIGKQGPSTRPRWPTANGTWPLRMGKGAKFVHEGNSLRQVRTPDALPKEIR